MEKTRHRILIVENDIVDQMAFQRFVKEINAPYDYKIASSIAEAKEILHNEIFDVILLDYLLGDGTAFDILSIELDTPIIVVTGSGDEEIAVKAMKSGAHDYLIKDLERNYLKMLPSTVELVISRKLTEETLKESEEKFRELFDNMGNGVAVYDVIDGGNDFVFKDMNKSGQKLSKVDITKIKGKSILEVFPGVKNLGLFDIFKKVYKTGKSTYLPTTLYKDDRIFQWIENYVYKLPSGEIVAVYDDITEKMEAEYELKENKKKYQNLVETIQEGIWALDENSLTTFVNPKMAELLGYSIEEMMGKHLFDFMDERGIEIAKDKLERRRQGIKEQHDFEFRKKDGSILYASLVTSPLTDEKGIYKGAIAGLQDITERKNAQEELEKMRNILLETGRIAKVGGWEFDTKTMKQIWTQEVYDIHELPYDYQPTVNNGIKFYSPSSRPIIEKAVNDIMTEGKPFDLELEFDTAKGNHKWVHAIGKAHMQNGDVIKVSGAIQDITKRMNIEKQLKESEEKHRTLFETMIQGVVYQDADGNIISANPSSERILGLTLDQMKGRTSVDPRWRSIHEDGTDFPGDTHPSMVSLKTGKEVNSVMGIFNPKYEEYRWININAVPLFRNNDKKPYRVYTTFEDITERKKAEEKINSLNEALRVLNKILRHDILNDLTVVMSACDMIQVDDQRLKIKAGKAIKKSVSLIEQMRELEQALVSDEALSEKSLRSVAESVVKNYPDIQFSIKGDCTVLCDEALNSVIDNIVRNAVVHGKTDRIDISIYDKDGNCEMRIADYGKGIPSDIKDKIFEEGESFGETRGSGLGLYIVKKVIERYGGDISVEENKPNGAVFIINLKKS